MKENGFTQKKAKKQTISYRNYDANYADDLVLLANTPAQAESLLYCLEPPARGIGLYINSDKTEFVFE